jgi:hypothetical protein
VSLRRVWPAAAVFAAGLALALVVLLRGGDEPPRRAGQPPPAAVATHPLAYPELGLRVGRPADWRARRRGDIVRLSSRDGAAVVAIATAPRRTPARRLRRQAERAVLDGYPGARVVRRSRAQLGGRKGPASALTAPAQGGTADVAVVAVETPGGTYATTAISSRGGPPVRAREVAAVLASLHFIGR